MGPEETAVLLFFGFILSTANWIRLSISRRRLQNRIDMAIANDLPATAILGNPRQAQRTVRDERVQDLEHQVDQIATQLDRLTESQEFLSRILTDRIDRLDDARLDTPH